MRSRLPLLLLVKLSCCCCVIYCKLFWEFVKIAIFTFNVVIVSFDVGAQNNFTRNYPLSSLGCCTRVASVDVECFIRKWFFLFCSVAWVSDRIGNDFGSWWLHIDIVSISQNKVYLLVNTTGLMSNTKPRQKISEWKSFDINTVNFIIFTAVNNFGLSERNVEIDNFCSAPHCSCTSWWYLERWSSRYPMPSKWRRFAKILSRTGLHNFWLL